MRKSCIAALVGSILIAGASIASADTIDVTIDAANVGIDASGKLTVSLDAAGGFAVTDYPTGLSNPGTPVTMNGPGNFSFSAKIGTVDTTSYSGYGVASTSSVSLSLSGVTGAGATPVTLSDGPVSGSTPYGMESYLGTSQTFFYLPDFGSFTDVSLRVDGLALSSNSALPSTNLTADLFYTPVAVPLPSSFYAGSFLLIGLGAFKFAAAPRLVSSYLIFVFAAAAKALYCPWTADQPLLVGGLGH